MRSNRGEPSPPPVSARIFAGIAAGLVVALLTAGRAQAACDPGANLAYVCGVISPEDLVAVPGSRFLIASSLRQVRGGGLVLIDTESRTAGQIEIASGPARAPFADCPGPPNLAQFSSHGLSLRPEGRGRSTLFAVTHGAREAIEVFSVDARSDAPKLTWIGCVRATEGANNNAVVGLKDGRIVVTTFMQAPFVRADVFAGRLTGGVSVWAPGGTFRPLAGAELSGANGAEVTPDLKWLFVASSGRGVVLRYELAHTERPPTVIDPGLLTDNLRWAPDGRLLLAGPGCKRSEQPCNRSTVAALDPKTLQVTKILEIAAEPAFPGLSAAVLVGKQLWLGSYMSDRVASAVLK